MKIEYLNKLHLFLKTVSWNTSLISVSELEIDNLKDDFNIDTFPKAYTEFLYLTGNRFPPLKLGHWFESLTEIQTQAKEKLKQFNLEHLIQKDFWVFAESDGSEAICYFHFDEGDNPPVYGLSMELYEDYPDRCFKKMADTFQEYIENVIDKYDPELDE